MKKQDWRFTVGGPTVAGGGCVPGPTVARLLGGSHCSILFWSVGGFSQYTNQNV